MELYKKILFCLTWLVTLYVIGILLFTKGFLLTRSVITNNSSCIADFRNETRLHEEPLHHGDGCWLKPLRKRAVFIVIDALRYDFVAEISSGENSHLMPYENKLRTLQNLLEDKPQNARLYKFMADPPTTTLQRLKGLTTGSLPTFIDVASNFDSSAISEDNIIDQLASMNKTLVFMGDDTWVNLFPGRFRRSYAFPSFNVKDLHTVDNGVIKHLVPELQKTDWDVLIAHFLGVDHCGHRYGPYHPAMADKLSQMDDVLKSVIELLDEDTILFVLGDHGMTKTGDHGGDSKDELQAALFIYSPTEVTQSGRQNKSQHEAISQTDLVPTVSLLLGTPIPFSNLGTLIVDLFNNSIDHEDLIQRKISSELLIINALKLNVYQVRRFIQTYASVSDEFSAGLLLELERRYTAVETELNSVISQLYKNHDHSDVIILSKLHKIRDQYLLYLSTIRTMCEEVWARFDLSLMALGITLTVSVIILSVYWLSSFTEDAPFQWQPIVIGSVGSFWMMSLVSLLAIVHLNLTDVIISLVIICGFIIVFGIIAAKLTMDFKLVTYFPWNIKPTDFMPMFVVVVYSLSLFSNSYIVFEDAVSAYLLQSVVAYNGWFIICKLYDQSKPSSQKAFNRKHKIQSFDIARQLTSPVSLTILTVLFTNSAIRLSSMFRACREEQWMCEPSNWLLPISSLAEDLRQYKNFRYCISIGCLICFSMIVTKWLQHWGNLNGYMPSVLSMKYLFPLGTVSIVFYWAVQAVPSKLFDSLPVWQVTFLPRIVYVVVILMLVCLFWNPLCLFLMPRMTQSQPLISNPQSEDLLPQMFNHLKANWKKHLHSTSLRSDAPPSTGVGPPIVYGLATVFSASHIMLVTSIVLLLFMLLGDNLSPSLFLCLTSGVMLLELNASLVEVSENSAFHVSWTSILTWSLLASEHFYSTGHQTVVTTIQWQSAFHGFHGDFEHYLLPAALILMNTFASYILTVVSLPLLVFWPRMRRGIIFHYDKPTKAEEVKDSRGEFILHEEEHKLWFAMFQILAGFVTIEGLKVLATMCCAMIHRRHLMVWKIFAPRFLFESVTFLIIGPLSILVYLFVVRVNHAIRSWIKLLDR